MAAIMSSVRLRLQARGLVSVGATPVVCADEDSTVPMAVAGTTDTTPTTGWLSDTMVASSGVSKALAVGDTALKPGLAAQSAAVAAAAFRQQPVVVARARLAVPDTSAKPAATTHLSTTVVHSRATGVVEGAVGGSMASSAGHDTVDVKPSVKSEHQSGSVARNPWRALTGHATGQFAGHQPVVAADPSLVIDDLAMMSAEVCGRLCSGCACGASPTIVRVRTQGHTQPTTVADTRLDCMFGCEQPGELARLPDDMVNRVDDLGLAPTAGWLVCARCLAALRTRWHPEAATASSSHATSPPRISEEDLVMMEAVGVHMRRTLFTASRPSPPADAESTMGTQTWCVRAVFACPGVRVVSSSRGALTLFQHAVVLRVLPCVQAVGRGWQHRHASACVPRSIALRWVRLSTSSFRPHHSTSCTLCRLF